MKRILVMNDDQELLELFRLLLTEEGYEVILSSYAIEELPEIERLHPDLIILDWMIGVGHPRGWPTLQKLKLHPSTKAIPLIICTAAERSVEEQQSYLASKGVTVVLKPFDLDELLHAIRKAFSFVNLPTPEKYMDK